MILFFSIINFLLLHYKFLSSNNILQKQYYSYKRYLLYLFEQKTYVLYKLLSVVCLFLTLFSNIFAFFGLFHFVEPFKNKIIKFKFSKRIIRHFIIFELLNLSTSVFIILNKDFISLFIANLSYFLLFESSFFISVFIEKIIQKHHIKLAKNKLKAYKTKIIAITGSYGKTSLKNYVFELAKNYYSILSTDKSFNTLNGILLTINNNLKPYHDYILLEIGVDEKGGMDKFVKLFKFDIGVVTTIGNQHLKTFKSIDNIAKEKIKLLYNCTDYVVINNEDPYINNLTFNTNTIKCSINKDSEVYLNKGKNNLINISIYNNKYISSYSLLGKHNLSNLSLAIGMCKALNIDDKHIISNINKLKNVDHRLSISIYHNWTIIDDSYNSNLNGFINALEELSNYDTFKILITPGIIENPLANKELINYINKHSDLVLITSNIDVFNKLNNKLFFNSFNEAFSYLKNNYYDKKLTILIENDLPDIYLR